MRSHVIWAMPYNADQPSQIDSDLAICRGLENLRIVLLKAMYKDDDGDSSWTRCQRRCWRETPFFVGPLPDWLESFFSCWLEFFLAGQSFSSPSLSMTTIANLTLCLAHHDVLSALMLVIQAPCYRQNKWYGSSWPKLNVLLLYGEVCWWGQLYDSHRTIIAQD